MRLTRYSDYAMRVLLHLGAEPDRMASIASIAEAYGVSRNHLMKVVFRLGQLGYLSTVRGRGGGMRLAKPPSEIVLGVLIRQTEEGLALVECFQEGNASCAITPCCRLKGVLGEALDAFLTVLDGYTLADLMAPRRRLAQLLGVTAGR